MEDRFTTSDGKVWIVKRQPEPPDWAPKETQAAHRYLVFGMTFIAVTVLAISLFIAVTLFGGTFP